jgi:4-hydroxy-tetrahydrodipicolinate reductase
MDSSANKRIPIAVNGIPGKVSVDLAKRLAKSDRFEVLSYALTGPEIELRRFKADSLELQLIRPNERDSFYSSIPQKPRISVDFTHPSAVNSNADFYCKHGLHFVMGTTGGDRAALEQRVKDSLVVAVIAPNMAKQIVAFQAMMKYAADNFPGVFRGYSLEITESHQKTKADTSGTAKALVAYFNSLGVPFNVNQIKMVRDPEYQLALGVPESALTGHGWHTYTLKSPNDSVLFRFTHNVNGRDVYVDGTIDALTFLDGKIALGETGRAYSMMDVLKG